MSKRIKDLEKLVKHYADLVAQDRKKHDTRGLDPGREGDTTLNQSELSDHWFRLEKAREAEKRSQQKRKERAQEPGLPFGRLPKGKMKMTESDEALDEACLSKSLKHQLKARIDKKMDQRQVKSLGGLEEDKTLLRNRPMIDKKSPRYHERMAKKMKSSQEVDGWSDSQSQRQEYHEGEYKRLVGKPIEYGKIKESLVDLVTSKKYEDANGLIRERLENIVRAKLFEVKKMVAAKLDKSDSPPFEPDKEKSTPWTSPGSKAKHLAQAEMKKRIKKSLKEGDVVKFEPGKRKPGPEKTTPVGARGAYLLPRRPGGKPINPDTVNRFYKALAGPENADDKNKKVDESVKSAINKVVRKLAAPQRAAKLMKKLRGQERLNKVEGDHQNFVSALWIKNYDPSKNDEPTTPGDMSAKEYNASSLKKSKDAAEKSWAHSNRASDLYHRQKKIKGMFNKKRDLEEGKIKDLVTKDQERSLSPDEAKKLAALKKAKSVRWEGKK
jgi:hypothetical protein